MAKSRVGLVCWRMGSGGLFFEVVGVLGGMRQTVRGHGEEEEGKRKARGTGGGRAVRKKVTRPSLLAKKQNAVRESKRTVRRSAALA